MSIRCSFHGSLGHSAETKSVNDNKVTRFSVANNTGYGDKKKTIWIECNAWGNRYEKLSSYLVKGQSVLIYGEIELNEYQGKDGSNKANLKCRVTDIELLGSKKERENEDSNESTKKDNAEKVDFNDDIPF